MCICQVSVIFLSPHKDFFPHQNQQIVYMTFLRNTFKFFLAGIFILFGLIVSNSAKAQDGKALFNANCASCHKMDAKLTGPALLGVEDRWKGNRKNLHEWILNSGNYLKKGDPYATNLFNEYGKLQMTAFAGTLDEKQVDAILDYIKKWAPPAAVTTTNSAAAEGEGKDNSLLFGIITLILAVVAFTLMQVNSSLKKLTDDKDGIAAAEPVPFWRNKTYIAFVIIVLFLVGGYYTTKGAIGLGRQKDYQPEQPIYYSHKVHAGVNQINCQYCHIGVYQGKQATIPSVNVCMNCHLAINEYKGEPIHSDDGKEINGTAEIQKLYKKAHYTPGQPWDASKAEPIEWVRIHNLPDHVYFNHSQHVVAGKVECQTCHGEVTAMGEVKQFADLSMGWCINCHRTTQVNFKGNGFYSIYEKYHEDLKNGKIDSTKGITVEKIGGTECQKCHY